MPPDLYALKVGERYLADYPLNTRPFFVKVRQDAKWRARSTMVKDRRTLKTKFGLNAELVPISA